MGLVSKAAARLGRVLLRASLENPSTPLSAALGVDPGVAGVAVNERTALRSTAVFAAVRVLSDSLASLPLMVMERTNDGGKVPAPDHPVFRLVHDAPSDEITSFTWRDIKQGHLCLWGNAYSWIIRDDDKMRPLRLVPLMPDVTKAKRDSTGQIVYESRLASGREIQLPANRVVHIPAFGFDGIKGYSPIAQARRAVELGLATEEFGSRFFGQGTTPTGVLEHPGALDDASHDRLSKEWARSYAGLANVHRAVVLEEGMKFTPLGVPPEDAQFLETRRFQVTEIARLFRLPPHMIGDLEKATFSNIEAQSIDFVRYSLRPWLVRWEQELSRKLLRHNERDRYFIEFKLDGILRGDSSARSDFYSKGVAGGWLTRNDVRRLENLNPLEGGDVPLLPLNMIPADQVGVDPAATERALKSFEGVMGDAMKRGRKSGRLAQTVKPVAGYFLEAIGQAYDETFLDGFVRQLETIGWELEPRQVLESSLELAEIYAQDKGL